MVSSNLLLADRGRVRLLVKFDSTNAVLMMSSNLLLADGWRVRLHVKSESTEAVLMVNSRMLRMVHCQVLIELFIYYSVDGPIFDSLSLLC